MSRKKIAFTAFVLLLLVGAGLMVWSVLDRPELFRLFDMSTPVSVEDTPIPVSAEDLESDLREIAPEMQATRVVEAIAVRQDEIRSRSAIVMMDPGSPETFQQGVNDYTGAVDTYISSWAASSNYGTRGELNLRTGGEMRPLISFDVSTIPSNAIVSSAVLRLKSALYGGNQVAVSAYRVLKNWSGSLANWNRAASGVNWTLPGASQTNHDRSAAAEGLGTVTGAAQWIELDITTMAQAWVTQPTQNYGCILLGTGASTLIQFYSSNFISSANRPQLVVTYSTVATTTPTLARSLTPPTPVDTATATATLSPYPGITEIPIGYQLYQQGVDGYDSWEDTYLDSVNPGAVQGARTHLNVRKQTSHAILIKFDLTDIPPASVIDHAILRLYCLKAGAAPLVIWVGRLRANWDEDFANWVYRTETSQWWTPGALSTLVDISAQRLDLFTVNEASKWYDIDITSRVQKWVWDPADNEGIVLQGRGTTKTVQTKFASSEHLQIAIRPKLEVMYTIVGGTPEPTPTTTETVTSTPAPTSTPTATGASTATVTSTRTQTSVLATATPLGVSGRRPPVSGPGLATPGVSYYVMHDQSYGSVDWDATRFDWCYEYYATPSPSGPLICNTANYGNKAGWPGHGTINGWAYWAWDLIDTGVYNEQTGTRSGPIYNWGPIDAYLRAAYSVGKQAAISVFTYDVTKPVWDRNADRTPSWIPDANYSRGWRMHYAEFVRALTARYDRTADYQIGSSWIRTSVIKGFWVMSGAYGENNLTGMPASCGNWIDDDVHWYNYGTPGYPTYNTFNYGSWGYWAGNQLTGYTWSNVKWDDGSLLGPFYVWERWVQHKEMWIIASRGAPLGGWVQWAADVAANSPRGPIGLKTNTLAYDLPRHHTTLDSKSEDAYWELVDPWIDTEQVYYNGQIVPTGGYWELMHVGQEHAYGANEIQTYWSMLPMITWHGNLFDTAPKFFEVLHGMTDTLIGHPLWDFMNKYMSRSPVPFNNGTFRLFRITAQGLRVPVGDTNTQGWRNTDRYDPANDWTFDFGHDDAAQCMTIISGTDKLLRSAPGWGWPAPTPTTVPDTEWSAAPSELTSNAAIYGRYGFAILELAAGESVEIKPYPDGYGNPNHDMRVKAIVANYGSQIRLSYNGKTHTTTTMDDGWKALTIGRVKFNPAATIKITAMTTPSGGENYVHMIIFEKIW